MARRPCGWTRQLDHVLERLDIPPPQRAWIRALHPALCSRTHNPFLWTVTLRADRVPARFTLTLPRVPISLVLKHALELNPDLDAPGLRLGGLMGALSPDTDDVTRWGIDLASPTPATWIQT